MREIIKMLVVLTTISVVSGTSLSFLENVTRAPIEFQKLKFVKGPAVLGVLPGHENDPIKDYEKDVLLAKEKGVEIRKTLFPAEKGGNLFAVAFEVTGEGYHGPIAIMLGIETASGRLTGIRIMSHTETPGLGARAAEPEFYGQFAGLGPDKAALSDKGGDVNAISGATLTSRGVTRAVIQGLELFENQKETILKTLEKG